MKYKRWRIAISLAVLAVMTAGFLTWVPGSGRVARWFASVSPSAAILALSVPAILFWALLTALFGRVFCSTMCPLGTVMDISAHVSRKVRPRRYRWSPARNILRTIFGAIFVERAVLASATVATISVISVWLDPEHDFKAIIAALSWGPVSVVLSGVFVFVIVAGVAAWRGRMLCNTVCPVGALMGPLSANAMLRFDINPDLCTHCGKCEDVCKAECIKQDVSLVDNSRCVACFNCVSVCPNGAITWRRGRHRLQWPMLMRTEEN